MTAALTIITNNQPRETFSGLCAELYIGDAETIKLRKQFDYLTETEFEDTQFVNYKGYYYCLGDFMRIPRLRVIHSQVIMGWEGYHGESYFSGILIKFTEDNDVIDMGRYYS
jgi:hypothetical protein